jgi:uncharacterized NAD(P)/FAD-binding protein YdhS
MKVLVVGGGASGTLVAINLARNAKRKLSVTIAEPNELIGRGVAYGTQDSTHLLNVPAGRMSALVEEPDHFCDWAGLEHNEFAPRKLYGEYLLETLTVGASENPEYAFEHRQDFVVSIKHLPNSAFKVEFQKTETETFDSVVLAIGHGAAISLSPFTDFGAHSRIVTDPWRQLYKEFEGTLVCVGTGLTFVDHALAHIRFSKNNTVIGISRTGLLPESHVEVSKPPASVPESVYESPAGLKDFIEVSDDWRSAVEGVRRELPSIWQSWGRVKQLDFFAKYLRWWNIRRHRASSEIHKELHTAIAGGRITILQDEIVKVRDKDSHIELTLNSGEQVSADLIVNCLGYEGHADASLIQSMVNENLAAVDDHKIGIKTNFSNYQVLNSKGNAVTGLFAIGPVLLGERFETTAIPEIRVQAQGIAENLIGL